MSTPNIFEGTSLIQHNGEPVMTEKMMIEFYNSKRSTIRDHINKSLDANLGNSVKVQAITRDGKIRQVILYNLECVVSVGMSLRTRKAIQLQKLIIRNINSELNHFIEEVSHLINQ